MNKDKYETIFRKELPRGSYDSWASVDRMAFALFEEPDQDFSVASLEGEGDKFYLYLYANYMTDSTEKFYNSIQKLVHNLDVAKKLGFQERTPWVYFDKAQSAEIYTQAFKPVIISNESNLIKIVKTINSEFKI